ncbi:sulfotransferase domain-containing protein [Paraburkholderia sp. SARCC-3016]|nr:sulfotransferase domain-containing protein [Paraburkholderia sp. SARCC-3016]MDQ7978074.1 sulfotransferase domain-containing protein [Paraburkholderia sp. SARCC-3016]
MLLSICGMPRSGSTFSFNIARELLASRGSIYSEPTEEIERVVAQSHADSIIIKNHNVHESGIELLKTGAMKGICTVRDPLDAIESLMDIFGFDIQQSIHAFQLWVDSFNAFHDHVLVIPYKTINASPMKVILRIARYLGVTPGPLEVLRLRRKYDKKRVMKVSNKMSQQAGSTTDLGFTYYDNENFFHRRHVRQEKRVSLDKETTAHIKQQLQRMDLVYSYL